MEDIKRIISQNIVALRKKNQLTQIDLAKKINYSDKAISRWENGEVVPDVETLQSLAEVFNVPLTYLFEPHKDSSLTTAKPSKNDLLYQMMVVMIIWTFVAIVFFYFHTFLDRTYWQTFLWGIPLTCVALLFFSRKYQMKSIKFTLKTVLCWSSITCVCLQFINNNLWLIYIIGIPIQAIIIMSVFRDKIK